MGEPWTKLRVQEYTEEGTRGAWVITPAEGQAGFDEEEVVKQVAAFVGTSLWNETDVRFTEHEGALVVSLFNGVEPADAPAVGTLYEPKHWWLRHLLED
jgi:hypothetical protein